MKRNLLASASLLAVAFLAGGLLISSHQSSPIAAAQSTGSIAGQVVWNAPMPVPYGVSPQAAPGAAEPDAVAPEEPNVSPDGTPDEASGAASPSGMPVRPGVRPYPRLIPAGAVLVAVQGTSLSARTDDQGRFRIDGVPTGQYLTVAAGPVRNLSTAVAVRPNVFVSDGGRTVSVGTLYLGQSYYGGVVPYGAAPSGEGTAEPGQITPDAVP